jgi:hypothetical protein
MSASVACGSCFRMPLRDSPIQKTGTGKLEARKPNNQKSRNGLLLDA